MPKYYGNYRGIVVDNLDPLNKGRVRVFIRGIYPDEFEKTPQNLPWAEPAMPVFGGSWKSSKSSTNSEVGFNSVPHAGKNGDGAQVWVFFDNGERELPVYFAISQSGDGWFSKHNNQHVLNTDNISIIIDEYNDAAVFTQKALDSAQKSVDLAQDELNKAQQNYDKTMSNTANDATTVDNATLIAAQDEVNAKQSALAKKQTELNTAQKEHQQELDKVITKRTPNVPREIDAQLGVSDMSKEPMRTRLAIDIIAKDVDKDCAIDLNIKGAVNLRIEGDVYKEIIGDIVEYHDGDYRLHRTGHTAIVEDGSTRVIKRGDNNSLEIEGSMRTMIEGHVSNYYTNSIFEFVESKTSILGSLSQRVTGPADLAYNSISDSVTGRRTLKTSGTLELIGGNVKVVGRTGIDLNSPNITVWGTEAVSIYSGNSDDGYLAIEAWKLALTNAARGAKTVAGLPKSNDIKKRGITIANIPNEEETFEHGVVTNIDGALGFKTDALEISVTGKTEVPEVPIPSLSNVSIGDLGVGTALKLNAENRDILLTAVKGNVKNEALLNIANIAGENITSEALLGIFNTAGLDISNTSNLGSIFNTSLIGDIENSATFGVIKNSAMTIKAYAVFEIDNRSGANIINTTGFIVIPEIGIDTIIAGVKTEMNLGQVIGGAQANAGNIINIAGSVSRPDGYLGRIVNYICGLTKRKRISEHSGYDNGSEILPSGVSQSGPAPASSLGGEFGIVLLATFGIIVGDLDGVPSANRAIAITTSGIWIAGLKVLTTGD